MRLVLYVFLLATTVVSGASAGWDWREATPQKFQVFDEYVIAVGTAGKLEPVQASAIVKAFEDGKEIRLQYAKIEGDVRFHDEVKEDVHFIYSTFSGGADFERAMFSGGANFERAIFSGVTIFFDARFSGVANFVLATFPGEPNFSDATFSGALFAEAANFLGAKFSRAANFLGATFSGEVNFSGATFSRVALFGNATFSGEANFIGSVFAEKADFSRTRFLKHFYLNLAIFGESGSLSLGNSVYPYIYVNLPDDPDKVRVFLNNPSEDTYLRLLKNQRDLGRPDKSLYVAMKRHQRAQKFPFVSWLEWFLFDFPTQYGTASFPPKGMLIYIAVVLVVFTASYYGINAYLRRSRDVEILEYNNTDGEEADRPEKLGRWEIVWFSLNTFTPAVHFVNMQHWRITDDRFLRIKCSTLATVESILGWLLIPILLRYFRL